MDLPLLATFLTSNIGYDLFIGKFMDEVLAKLLIKHLKLHYPTHIFIKAYSQL